MNKTVLSVLGLFPVMLFSQNGVTTIQLPSTYYSSVKNTLVIDAAENKWIGFSSKGIAKYDGTGWTMYDISSGLPSNNVKCIAFSGTTAWAGTDHGAAQLNGSSWTVYDTQNSGLASDTVYTIVASGADTWFCTHRGLSKLNGTTWTSYNTANSGLPDDRVLSLAVDANNELWIGTYAGFVHYNGSAWTVYTSSNSLLPSNIVRQVYIDNAGYKWAGSGGTPSGAGQYDLRFNGTNFETSGQIYFSGNASFSGTSARGPISTGPSGTPAFFMNQSSSAYAEMSTPVRFYNPGQGIFKSVAAASTGHLWFIATGSQNYHLYELDPSQHSAIGLVTPDNTKHLDANEVDATLLNRGDLHWNTNSAAYEVPKGNLTNAVFVSDLWIGALDNNGNLHQAAMTYRQSGMDFFPGPLDTMAGTTDSLTAAKFDRIWKIEKVKIQEFQYYWSTGDVQNGNYIPDDDFLTWPAHGGANQMHALAPFVDVNGNGIYDPLTGGDYPEIKGDQMLYWIFNDNLAAHGASYGGQPLKVEVHASAYSFYCPSVADSEKIINYTTYYHFDIYNWSGQPYHDAYIGFFQDADLGAYDDDLVGCYPPANIAFTYTGDAYDGCCAVPTIGTYGDHPPILSLQVLKGPFAVPGDSIDNDNDGVTDEIGERNLLTDFLFYYNDFTGVGNPEAPDDFYNFMQAKWKDSTDVTYGGNGYGGTTPTHFMYPDLPYVAGGWSEMAIGNTPYDRRFVASSGPFNLLPGQPQSIDYALLFTRDTTVGANDSAHFALVLRDAAKVRSWFAMQSEPTCVQWGVGIADPQGQPLAFGLYPNPSSGELTIVYQPGSRSASYEIIDLTGRVIASGGLTQDGRTQLDTTALDAGVYFIRIVDNGRSGAVKFIRE